MVASEVLPLKYVKILQMSDEELFSLFLFIPANNFVF